MRSRAKVASIFVLLLLIVAGYVLYQRFGRGERLRFPYLVRPLPSATYAALAAQPGWAASELGVAEGISLRGLVRRPRAADAPWILFYPGNDFTQLETGQRFLQRLAADRDLGLAVYAYRGFDRSDGEPSLDALAHDAPVVLEQFCREYGVPSRRVHVVGFSIGGHFAVHAARGSALAKRALGSLILLASVDDIVMVRRSPWQALSPGDDYQTRPLLGDVAGPVLVLQGDADEALDGAGQGRAIAGSLGQRARYLEFAGVGHEALLSHEPALAAARQFISEQRTEP